MGEGIECPHCGAMIPDEVRASYRLGEYVDSHWILEKRECAACGNFIVHLVKGPTVEGNRLPFWADDDFKSQVAEAKMELSDKITDDEVWGEYSTKVERILLWPKYYSKACPPEVPEELAEDYNEAWRVLDASPKASATLSRRCLQNILREKLGATGGNLLKEIDDVKGGLPSYIGEKLHMLREIGNFAAHPGKSENTGEILPVEPEEAELSLELLEQLFDHCFVKPGKHERMKEELNKKLKETGRRTI
jgi:hypothetical protein